MMNDNQFIIYGNYTFEYNNLNGSMINASGRVEYHKRKLIGKRLAFDEVVKVSKKINKQLNYASK